MYNKIILNENDNGTFDLVLFYNELDDTEFGLEFLSYDKIKNNIHNIFEYIKIHGRELKINTIKIMFGTALIASMPFQYFMNVYGAELSKYSMAYLYSGSTTDQISYISRTNNSVNNISPSYFDIIGDGSIKVNITSTELITYAHNQGIKVIPFLSNHWDRQAGINALNNADLLSTQIANYISTYNLDGINIDIENVTENERNLYTNFVTQLRQKISSDKEVSVAVAANPNGWTVGWHGSYDYTNLANNSNYLMVMAYDEHWQGSDQGPVASISFVENSIKYALSKTSSDKIVLGMPLYGRIWSQDNNFNGNGVTLEKIQSIISTYNANITYDQAQQAPKATFTVTSSDPVTTINGKTLVPGNYTIWYENETSIQQKISLITKYNLKGSSVWALGQEPISIWQNYSNWLNNVSSISTTQPSENTSPITTINKTGTVTATVLNIRNLPSTNSTIIGTLKKGASVNVISLQNGWYTIKLADGRIAYVSSSYVTINPDKAPTAVTQATTAGSVLATVLNVRTSPNTNSRVITTLKKGTSINILSSTNGWYNIKLANGTTGYVKASYISTNTTNNTTTSTTKTGVITTSILNVRSLATTQSKIIGYLRKNNTVSILSSQNGWYKIKLSNGSTGYISSNYVKLK